MEQAANIYYDVKGMGTQTMKYKRGDPLVPDHEVNKLTTFMRQLHEYYMAQATESLVLRLLSIIIWFFIMLKKRSSMSSGSACSSYTRDTLLIHRY
jgi:hypothetical protein